MYRDSLTFHASLDDLFKNAGYVCWGIVRRILLDCEQFPIYPILATPEHLAFRNIDFAKSFWRTEILILLPRFAWCWTVQVENIGYLLRKRRAILIPFTSSANNGFEVGIVVVVAGPRHREVLTIIHFTKHPLKYKRTTTTNTNTHTPTLVHTRTYAIHPFC